VNFRNRTNASKIGDNPLKLFLKSRNKPFINRKKLLKIGTKLTCELIDRTNTPKIGETTGSESG